MPAARRAERGPAVFAHRPRRRVYSRRRRRSRKHVFRNVRRPSLDRPHVGPARSPVRTADGVAFRAITAFMVILRRRRRR